MFGFLIGTASLLGLIYVIRHTDAHGRCLRGWHRSGSAWALGRIFTKLDTTPGQEKVIRNAVDDLLDRLRDRGDELRRTRKDLADAVRGEHLDEVRLGEVFARHDAIIGVARQDVTGALAQVHEVLDERQRRRLARMIESGPFLHPHHGFGGPYRRAGCTEEA